MSGDEAREVGRNGGERASAVAEVEGRGEEGVNPSIRRSWSRMLDREDVLSQAGGRMLARRWRLRRRASQRGMAARLGGRRGFIGPWWCVNFD